MVIIVVVDRNGHADTAVFYRIILGKLAIAIKIRIEFDGDGLKGEGIAIIPTF